MRVGAIGAVSPLIFGAEQTAAASGRTVSRRSLKVRPTTPRPLDGFAPRAAKPVGVHGMPSVVVRMIVLRSERSASVYSAARTSEANRAANSLGWAARGSRGA
jgi:hypothetical protein